MTPIDLKNGYYDFALQKNCKAAPLRLNNLAKNATNPIAFKQSNTESSANIGFGSLQEKSPKRLIKEINAIEKEYEAKYPELFNGQATEELKKKLSEELQQKTIEFKKRLKGKEKVSEWNELEKILPEAYAMMKIAARVVFGYKEIHDVQLLGAIAMHRGQVAEMKTGEGKTLTATFPAYLNALTGKGVHVITVNDYLAKRDAEKMQNLYAFLGLESKYVSREMTIEEKQKAYGADITYGMNSTFAFDYLDDNRATTEEKQVQRPFNFAIVDEADSVLIDEAITPYILSLSSGTTEDTIPWKICAKLAEQMQDWQDYEPNESEKNIILLGSGEAILEKKLLELDLETEKDEATKTATKKLISIIEKEIPLRREAQECDYIVDYLKAHKHKNKYKLEIYKERLKDLEEEISSLESEKTKLGEKIGYLGPWWKNIPERYKKGEKIQDKIAKWARYSCCMQQALKAKEFFKRNKEYTVINGEVKIVDDFTGRSLEGRQWSEGLHQAIEAKEGVKIHAENETAASIASYDFYKKYKKLCGMTGTVASSEEELNKIYGLTTESIPTNIPSKRIDFEDALYETREQQYAAVIEEVKKCLELGRPVLIGTTDIEDSEELSRLLNNANIKHNVLNAKNNAREAEIVKQAGQKGAVTIATNMAGRGTDIILSDEVRQAGGLHVIGTERQESERIDEQLRGRCARQGDPGSTQFILSLQDKIIDHNKYEELKTLTENARKNDENKDKTILGNTISEGKITSKKIIKEHKAVQKEIESSKSTSREKNIQREEILNDQKRILYQERQKIVKSKSIEDIVNVCVRNLVHNYIMGILKLDDLRKLISKLNEVLSINLNVQDFIKLSSKKELEDKLTEKIMLCIKETGFKAIKDKTLKSYDEKIKEFLKEADSIMDGVQWQVYAQKDLNIEYAKEAHEIFTETRAELFTEILKNMQIH